MGNTRKSPSQAGGYKDYFFKPGIIPRFKDLFGYGFSTTAYFVAVLFVSVRLLDRGHPALQPGNIGRYSIGHIIVEAAQNLEFSRRNIDQIAIFTAIVSGLIILAMYAVSLILYVMISPALAQSIVPQFNQFTLFYTPNPESDIAFRMLDGTFGVEGIYNSQVTQNAAFPNAFHQGMHVLFGYYSTVLLFFAIFIFLYYIVVVVYETAQSGTPFGQRFNSLWAPLRLIFALGLLIPLSSGLNSGQYMLLYIAKYGSGLATQAWDRFSATLSNPLGGPGEGYKMVAKGKMADVSDLVGNMLLVRSCYDSYRVIRDPGEDDIKIYLNDDGDAKEFASVDDNDFLPSFFPDSGAPEYEAINALYDNKQQDMVVLRFGKPKPEYQGVSGRVRFENIQPLCGEIHVPIHRSYGNLTPEKDPAFVVTKAYIDILLLQFLKDNNVERYSINWTTLLPEGGNKACENKHSIFSFMSPSSDFGGTLSDCTQYKNPGFVNWITNDYQSRLSQVLQPGSQFEEAVLHLREVETTQDVQKYGWGGAGIWYNRIARYNGPVMDAIHDIPYMGAMPQVMEKVQDYNARTCPEQSSEEPFKPTSCKGKKVELDNEKEPHIADLLHSHYQSLVKVTTSEREGTNVIFDAVNFLFHSKGLFDVFENRDVHPLAQLTGFGRSMMQSALSQIYFSFGFSFLSGLEGGNNSVTGATSQLYAGFALTSLTLGIMMFYFLPFLPFIYFFFAVAKWVRSIFEAMVGIPLWALTHISIEGDGFPTQASENGYYLLLEIFIRPVLVVFGLVAAIIIFAAQVLILNEIFDVVTSNLAGVKGTVSDNVDDSLKLFGGTGQESFDFDYYRSRMDEFFYTIMYVIIVYLLAISSFKLIDVIPNHILRWAGSGVSAFAETVDDPTENLQRNAAIAAQLAGGSAVSAGNQVGAGIGSAGGGTARALTSRFGNMDNVLKN